MANEIEFKDVFGFAGYVAGSDGSIWSYHKNTKKTLQIDGRHLIHGGLDKDGYRKAILCKGREKHYVRQHSIILTAFKGPPPNSPEPLVAAHINGNRIDNRQENLRWDTQKGNVLDKIAHGTHQKGDLHGSSIVCELDVTAIRNRRANGEKLKTLANELGIHTSTISAICSRRIWKHVK